MKKINFLLIGTMAVLGSGCGTVRLSQIGSDITAFAEVVTKSAESIPQLASLPRIQSPIKLGVNQFGKRPAPKSFLKELESHSSLIREAVLVCHPETLKVVTGQNSFDSLKEAIIQDSKKLDLDYVFLYGSMIHTAIKFNAAEPLDMLVLPAFVIPSRIIEIKSDAFGALLEVGSGDVVFVLGNAYQSGSNATGSSELRKVVSLRLDHQAQINKQVGAKLISKLRKISTMDIVAEAAFVDFKL